MRTTARTLIGYDSDMAEGRHPLTGKFMPGFSGNPSGPAKGRKISHQIDLLLEQEDPETGKKRVELLAEKMLEHALAGKAPAWPSSGSFCTNPEMTGAIRHSASSGTPSMTGG